MATFNMARALVATGGDRIRALALAREALDGLDKDEEAADAEGWLAEHGDPPAHR